MPLPLSLTDFSLWVAITAIILLITSELLSPSYGKTRIMINRRRLRMAALGLAIIFLISVAYRIYEIVGGH